MSYQRRDGTIPATLTPRELEVLQLVAHGLTNVQVGAALGIAPDSVKNHVMAACQRLRVRNRTAAACKGLREGIIE